jgi:hypothetical protein
VLRSLRQAKNRDLEVDAAEIRIRAERRLGELIKAQKETEGLNQGAAPGKTGLKSRPVLDTRPTLKGELIKAQAETEGLNRGGGEKGVGRRGKNAVDKPDRISKPTLKEAGISKDLSSRSQKLASVPEAQFEAEMGKWREKVKQENERAKLRA